MAQGRLTRPAAAKAKAAERRLAVAAAKRSAKACDRRGSGPLRDKQIRPATLVRYTMAMQTFFLWISAVSLMVPDTSEEFDSLLQEWAEALYSEGDPKSLYANCLSGLQHKVHSLRGRLRGAWRLYGTWTKSEPPSQAPPMTVAMVHAMAGFFASLGERAAAIMILVAFNCILRIAEMCKLRPIDCTATAKSVLMVLIDPKVGGRAGVHEQVTCTDPWLAPLLSQLVNTTPSGGRLLGMDGFKFRRIWKKGRTALGLPAKYTPYSIRRGGATALFKHCGRYDKVSEKGRWNSVKAMRGYINAALTEIPLQDELRGFRKVSDKYAQCLRVL
jgi:integrase